MKGERILVGLDIGTTKVCALVGEVSREGWVDIIGVGTSPSRGLKNGIVIDMEKTVDSIKKAVREAEIMAGVQINSVYTGIAGGHIKGFTSRGMVTVKDREIRTSDIERVIDAARAVEIPLERELLHCIPQQFIVDGQEGIKDPIGMAGMRLEAEVYIVTGAVTSAQNIVRCVNRAGLDVADIILQPLASSEAILTAEEKDLGVVVVDIGGGTTDIAIFSEGSFQYTRVIAIGGNNFTMDIAHGLSTPVHEAEKIKILHGCVEASLVREDEMVEVPTVGGRPPRSFSRHYIASRILQPRAEEVMDLVSREIRRQADERMLTSGMILTGGAAQMGGIIEVAERIVGLPVQRGLPRNCGGVSDVFKNPIYTTGVGLLLFAAKDRRGETRWNNTDGNVFYQLVTRMKKWIKDSF